MRKLKQKEFKEMLDLLFNEKVENPSLPSVKNRNRKETLRV